MQEGILMATLTVTAKGQITLKQELLRRLNVAPGQKIEIEDLPDGRIALGPVRKKGSIAALSGMLASPNNPRLTIAQIKKITEDAWAGKR
jgi:AbrB family looped-hinge helix DNA binding protein